MVMKQAKSSKSSLFISFMIVAWKWLLYLFKYLQQLVCSSTWKNELSSWEMRPKRLGFPFANKMAGFWNFFVNAKFLVTWVKWVEVEGWEMGLKDLCNKSWEMPLRRDQGLHSLFCGCVFNLMKDLFPIMFFIILGKQQICHLKIPNSKFKMTGSMKG